MQLRIRRASTEFSKFNKTTLAKWFFDLINFVWSDVCSKLSTKLLRCGHSITCWNMHDSNQLTLKNCIVNDYWWAHWPSIMILNTKLKRWKGIWINFFKWIKNDQKRFKFLEKNSCNSQAKLTFQLNCDFHFHISSLFMHFKLWYVNCGCWVWYEEVKHLK